MNSIGTSDLIKIFKEDIAQLLNKVIDAKYALTDAENDSILGAQRELLKLEIKNTIEALCCSAAYKIELLSYKLETIKSFDWSTFHNFKYHQGLSEDNKVYQELYGGSFRIGCSDKEMMEQFIFTEITSFFSNISGIIDNIALLIKKSFNLDIKGMVLLNKVFDSLGDGPVKVVLTNYTYANYNFWGMRDVRTACEHRDLTKVFPYSERAGLGKRDLGVLYINEDIIKSNTPEDNRVDIYCGFLYGKMCDFIKEFAIALTKSVSL